MCAMRLRPVTWKSQSVRVRRRPKQPLHVATSMTTATAPSPQPPTQPQTPSGRGGIGPADAEEPEDWQLEALEESETEEEASHDSEQEEMDAAEEAELPHETDVHLSPSEVRFTHANISSSFRNGTRIDDVIRSIVLQEMAFDDFPVLVCTTWNDKIYSINNRRLFVARVLEKLGKLNLISITLIPFDHPLLLKEQGGLSKWQRSFSTTSGGQFVRVRSDFVSQQADKVPDFRKRDTNKKGATLPLKPICLYQNESKGKAGKAQSARQTAQQAKWHLQESVPQEIMDQLGREYAISWEVMVHPRNPKIAAIKLWPNSNSKSRAPSPGRYSEGVHLFREAVAKRYVIQRKNQRIKQMSVSSLSAPMRLSVQEQRAAEKEKSLAKKKKHRQ
ncbi:unnamed protein product [Effrenium voratum]|uniref:Uncharacterized protein n=1 Tax=Effrenium voratum TaxID=2562239 RepID=A0AA36JGW2_9DINO|nr:unnamed protein product [Effrenium voratum]CAJ1436002.1 unnamed protein product [Effrenium voratum]